MSLDHNDASQAELDQRHQYARHSFDRHIQWAALLCTLNAVAAGWLASGIEFQLDIFTDVTVILINSHAIYVSARMLKHNHASEDRMNEITKYLQKQFADDAFPVQSAFDPKWQCFVVKQFRLAFDVLIVCWFLSIGEAFYANRTPSEENARVRGNEHIGTLVEVQKQIEAIPAG